MQYHLQKRGLVRIVDSSGNQKFGYYRTCYISNNVVEILQNTDGASWEKVSIGTVELIEKH